MMRLRDRIQTSYDDLQVFQNGVIQLGADYAAEMHRRGMEPLPIMNFGGRVEKIPQGDCTTATLITCAPSDTDGWAVRVPRLDGESRGIVVVTTPGTVLLSETTASHFPGSSNAAPRFHLKHDGSTFNIDATMIVAAGVDGSGGTWTELRQRTSRERLKKWLQYAHKVGATAALETIQKAMADDIIERESYGVDKASFTAR